MPKKSTKQYDFSGYASKYNTACADGRIIRQGAFKDNDGEKIPLVWHHQYDEPTNVLGHALLEDREDGLYCFAYLNESKNAEQVKTMLKHEDIESLSIFANNLTERATRGQIEVSHGVVREVSLVLAGANPGAKIDTVILHDDSDESEAIIFSGESIIHGELKHDDNTEATTNTETEPTLEEMEEIKYGPVSDEDLGITEDSTIEEVIDSFSPIQRKIFEFIIDEIEKEAEGNSDTETDENQEETTTEESTTEEDTTKTEEELKQEDYSEGVKMHIFEEKAKDKKLSHGGLNDEQLQSLLADAMKQGSLKSAFFSHGITGIDNFFPDAELVGDVAFTSQPVSGVDDIISGTTKSPFNRIKSLAADITATEARAKGYVKGREKVEEVISTLKRVTIPQTVYKKQGLDRDDILDIKDFDIVQFLWKEMRYKLNEEVARAILVGDGRSASDDDKIFPSNIRPIASDADIFTIKKSYTVPTGEVESDIFIETVVKGLIEYQGSGAPVMFVSKTMLTDLRLLKDGIGRRLYNSDADIAAACRVSKIIETEFLEDVTMEYPAGTNVKVQAVIVNLRDYVVGSARGGELTMFDDFDIDYNKYKYLIETRLCGALVQPKSALTIVKPIVTP